MIPDVDPANNGTQQQPQQPPKTPQQPQQPKPIVSPQTCLYWQMGNWWFRGFSLGVTASGQLEVGVPLLIVNLASGGLQSAFCGGGGATHW